MTSAASTPSAIATNGRICPASPLAEGLTWAGLILVLAPMLFRAMTQVSTLPYWDMDPLISWSPLVGIGPAGSLLVDALIILGAGLLLIGTARHARNAWFLFAALLVSIGGVPIVYHGWSSTVFTLGQQRIGASWASAMIAGLALWHAGTDRRIRIVAFAATISFIAVLAVRGMEQVFIEHPSIVENFKRNRDAILAAQGWTPDSSMARGYERRLMQAEATGWFGLSNVYASFAAASSVAFGALSWIAFFSPSLREGAGGRVPASPTKLVRLIIGSGLVLSLAALALADSKGGFAAAAMGFVFVSSAMWFSRPNAAPVFAARLRRFAHWLGPALVAAALLAVVARGLIGERIGELSVLFRWFYMQAAARIAVDQPFLGVGPDGFKDAYLIFKNPLSPEEVSSPHSVLFDWWACLGICGFAWVGLWLWWVARAGKHLFPSVSSADASPVPDLEARPLIRATSGIIILATLAAIWTETAALTPEAALIRIVGLGLWLGLAGGIVVIAVKHPRWVAGLAGAALVMAVHGQIEVTGSFVQSTGLFVAIVAFSASQCDAPDSVPTGDRLWARGPVPIQAALVAIGAVFALNAGLLGWRGVVPAFNWESSLRGAANELRPIGEARQWLGQAKAASTPQLQDEYLSLARASIREALGADGTSSEPLDLLKVATQRRLPGAIARLHATPEFDWRVGRELERLKLLAAQLGQTQGTSLLDSPIDATAPRVDSSGRTLHPINLAARASWGSAASYQLAELSRDTPKFRLVHLASALSFGQLALLYDPYNLALANRVLHILNELCDHGPAEVVAPVAPLRLPLARRVLELDDLQRLDRSVRGLTPTERREVEDLVKRLESAPKPTPTIP